MLSLNQPDDFARLGIHPTQIAQFEDGMRTSGGKDTFEWWYFDARMADGASLVIVFATKQIVGRMGALKPFVMVTLEEPGQPKRLWEIKAAPQAFSSSREKCDVRMGENYFRGDLRAYEIHVESADILVDVSLTGQVPAWRPGTGHLYFGEQNEHYFAWLPAVPQGEAQIKMRVNGAEKTFGGVGYHDHNWGNAPMPKLMHHWYWGRAKAGEYSMITSYITAEKAYGGVNHPVFMLAKNGKIIADDASKVSFSLEDEFVDERSGKPVANKVVYLWQDGNEAYKITYLRDRTIEDALLIDSIHGAMKFLAKLARFDGAYLRFTGRVTCEHFVDGNLIEKAEDAGIWELMYFGRVYK